MLRERNLQVGALAVCLAVVLFSPLAAWLVYHTPAPPLAPDFLAQLAVDARDIHPEPGEKRAYFLALLFFPLAIPLLQLGLERFSRLLGGAGKLFSVLLWVALAAFVLGPNNTAYLEYSWLGWGRAWRFLGLGLLALVWKARRLVPGRQLLGLASLLALLCLGLVCYLHGNDPYMTHPHFNAVYYSMVQLFQGRILLLDFFNQYGLYPYYLLPWFRLVGLSVESFSLTMGVLNVVSFGLLYYCLLRICRRPAIASLGLLACVNLNYFAMKQLLWKMGVLGYLDPYFQYWPIRMLFPCLMLAMLVRGCPYWLGTLVVSAGCFWNLDSGLPTWGTWVATFAYGELLRPVPFLQKCRGVLLRVLSGLGCLLVLAAALQSRLPLEGLVHIHKVFYGIGYFMLPMPPVHAWNVAALLYFAGLAYAFQALREGREALRPRLIFALSILGMGLFSYFQGRSHDWVLFLASWPASVLATVFLDDLWHERERGGLTRALGALLAALLINYALSLPFAIGCLVSDLRVRLKGEAVVREAHVLNEELAFLEGHAPFPKRIVILSNHSSLLHQLTNTQFLELDSLIEMFQIAENRKIEGILEAKASPVVLVSEDFENERVDYPWRGRIWDALLRNYEVSERSQNGILRVYRPKKNS
ncbi:hypothetical protein ABS71_16350 [bacterium SCN 62-11]|nr:hypothetical protein [Candidatus Eremiobacteraeota bacterium]ODT62015.1 MAG: hypothetical protein ABS71_16350 [bacterium SCN 62-11]